MIEINLLPEELRQAEGTPPARFGAIIGGVVLACGFGFWIGKYYLVDIPGMKSDMEVVDREIAAKKKQKEKMQTMKDEIEKNDQKAKTLNNLIHSRIRYARLLNYLCKAVPDNVWFKSFNVQADTSPPPTDLTPLPNAKRYMISLTGFATASTGSSPGQARNEENVKLAELMNNLKKWFCEDGVDENQVSIFLGARFRQPRLITATVTTLPAPLETDPVMLKALDAPKEGLEFSMTLSFELPQKS
jgi:hypothetical protein